MNKIMISGRLIRAPEVKEMEKNNILCTIFIANDVWFGTNKKTGFYKCQAWGQIGKIISENAKTGTELFVTGRLEQYRYDNDKGEKVYDNYIVVEQFDFGAKANKTNEEHPSEDNSGI
jgi:single stranded DNA-binding protein